MRTRSRPQRSRKVSCVIFDSREEADTPPRVTIRQSTKKRNQSEVCGTSTYRSKKQSLAVQQPLLALNTRSSPKQLFNAMMRLSDRQKEAINKMGFGGLLGFSVNGIPDKIAFHVVDNFDADSISLNLGNRILLLDGGLISKLLRIRDKGLCFTDIKEAKTLHPSLKAWRARIPLTSYITLSLVSVEIQNDKNGYIKDKILKRLTANTRYEDYNWCGFIIGCLRKCKKKWRPWDPKCCWAGHLTILTVNSTRRPAYNTGDGVRAIHYSTKELLTRRQNYEISNGGFSRGQVKPLSDGIAEKGVSEQRVNFCGAGKNDESTSGATSCVDKCVDELVALRSRIKKALSHRLTEEPNNEVHQRLKRKYIEVLDVLQCFPAEELETFE
ncbi:hypothetical protein Hanom_Chr01g00042241 [Helianthus anomalus]